MEKPPGRHNGTRRPDRREPTVPRPPSPEIERELDRIDFVALKTIFEDERGRCGLSPSSINFVPREKFFGADPSRAHAAVYDFLRKEIRFGADYLQDALDTQPDMLGRAVSPFSVVASTVVHEETHAVGHSRHYTPSRALRVFGLRSNDKHELGVGYRVRRNGVLVKQGYDLLNEAITDRIAEEIFSEYVKRRPTFHREVSGSESVTSADYMVAYRGPRIILEALTRKVAEVFQVPTELTWKGFKRAYFEGLGMGNVEVQKLLVNASSPRFVELLHDFNNYHDREQLKALSDEISRWDIDFPQLMAGLNIKGF